MGNINAVVHLEHLEGGQIALIGMDNPPVNALGHALRSGLAAALGQARADRAVKAVILIGTERAFSAGADISEFGKPRQAPGLIDIIDLLDAMEKPVIAALSGQALGGGCELALGCHYRVAAPGARIGLPEVKLGLLPGAGGTQRLPRLAGVERAVHIIVSGDPVAAEQALHDGIIDAVLRGRFARKRWPSRAASSRRQSRCGGSATLMRSSPPPRPTPS